MASEPRFPVPMVAASAVLDRRPALVVDLRSPGEFAEDHLSGARNVPLFDDLERALIGTLYKQSSPQAAFEEGGQRTRAKIVAFTRELAAHCGWEIPPVDLEQRVLRLLELGLEGMERELAAEPAELRGDELVLHCWRGGLRSRAVIAFLRGLGLTRAVGLEGGYRAYRACVRARIGAWEPPPSFVLRGLTGVGKTLVLRELARLRPEWTLDLEGLAGHRSSILGMVGLEPASQKLFESRLAERLARGLGPVCVVEGESRKVGDLVLPEPVWRAIDGGVPLELTADRARRVAVLREDYLAREESRAELARQLPFLEQRLGPRWEGALVALLGTGREDELVEILLERYYDPLYRHSEKKRRYAASFDASAPAAAAAEIAAWIEARRGAAQETAPRTGPPARRQAQPARPGL